jgi:hypothetical protein
MENYDDLSDGDGNDNGNGKPSAEYGPDRA